MRGLLKVFWVFTLAIMSIDKVTSQENSVNLFINNAYELETEIIDVYVSTLHTNLAEIGFTLHTTEIIDNTNLTLNIIEDDFREGFIEIYLETTTFPILPESRILYPTSEYPFTFEETDQYISQVLNSDEFQIVSKYLALYSVNQCSVAKSFQPAVGEMVQGFGLTRGKVMDFYVGNCALVLGEIDEAVEYLSYSASFTIQPFINDQHALVNLSWLYVTYDFEWNGFKYWQQREENPIELIGYFECDRFEGPCWAGINSHVTDMATKIILVEKQLELITKRAQLYALSLDYDSAIADIDEAVAIAEENELSSETLAELYTIRGEIIFLIYEWDRVEDNFTMAIDLNPDYGRAYFQRGVLFYTMARRDDALVDFQTYLDLEANGIYAEEAQSYIESIEIELDALGG